MDDRRFDELGRRLAGRYSRRGAVGLVAATVATLRPDRRALAQDDDRRLSRCLTPGQSCSSERGATPCCFGVCVDGVCCPEEQVAVDRCCLSYQVPCYGICCPPETIACGAPTVLPDGTVLPGTCVCPEQAPHCGFECCEDVCCGGKCCNTSNPGVVCLGDACVKLCESVADCGGVKGNNAACIDGLCCDEWNVCGGTCCTEGECIDGECQITR